VDDRLAGAFQEGLQFRCVKLFEAGRPVHSLIDVIAANVRVPDVTLGDMHAQAASLRLGEWRFQELCAKVGLPGRPRLDRGGA
jgi:N-methylhydantoinase B